jgi:hypothetical protein
MFLCNNRLIFNTLNVIIQVIFVFYFLVLFYFFYVVNVEKKDFKEQIDLLTDILFLNYKSQIQDIIKINSNKISKEDLELLIYGLIDTLEENIRLDSKDAINKIITNNNKLKTTIINILIGILCFCSILFLIFQCYPVYTIFKESIITVFFIALVELLFLNYISGKYISADPNKVKNLLGISIKNWIEKNKKLN